jgi:hypothetical protein
MTIGIDLAKNVFQIHGANKRGKAVLRKQLRREQMTASSPTYQRARSEWKPVVARTIGLANFRHSGTRFV